MTFNSPESPTSLASAPDIGGTAHDLHPSSNVHFEKPEIKGLKKLTQRSRRATNSHLQQWIGWEEHGRGPYHEYVHRLVRSGWNNLTGLDEYMCRDFEDEDIVISVVDIMDDFQQKQHPDMHDEAALKAFIFRNKRDGVRVRLFMAEQMGSLSSSLIEAFGDTLQLDPRFFQWNINGNKGLLSPAERHRAPFTSIGFTVLDSITPLRTDTSFFRVSVYIQPDTVQGHWTGLILFNSHNRVDLSINTLVTPTRHGLPIPAPRSFGPKTIRELYLSSLEYLDTEQMISSPFYALHYLFRLNHYCWSQVITVIRDEDRQVGGISETSVTHTEDIKKSFDIVKRGGSLGWASVTTERTQENKICLEEDFAHLMNQANLLWSTREKLGEVRQRRSDARITALTNAFTFFFLPISIVSSIYGMNVYEISGSSSNPAMWQMWVTVAGLNVVIVLILAVWNWISILLTHKRRASFKEILGFALGRRG